MQEIEFTEEERQSVLRTFFKDGKLTQMPAQRKKQVIVLHELAKIFEKNKVYTEFEVTKLLKPICEDFCTARRDLVELNILSRDNGNYKLK